MKDYLHNGIQVLLIEPRKACPSATESSPEELFCDVGEPGFKPLFA